MLGKRLVTRVSSVLLVVVFLLIGVLPAQADPGAAPLYASGNFVWAKGMGGTDYEWSSGIALDSNGNIYTVGAFNSTADFDPSPGTLNLVSAGGLDIFVSMLDSDGALVWAKRIGETGSDVGQGIAVDSNGNVYITGYFAGAVDFDPGTGVFTMTSAGGQDIFVTKLDSDGNFVWAKRMGGTGDTNDDCYNGDCGYDIALDLSGNVYTTGVFRGTADFDPDAGVYTMTSAGGQDIFISKLDSGGNFVWAKSIGGTYKDYAYGLAIDLRGNVYTTGGFDGAVDFDPGPGTFNLTSIGFHDIFVSKLDSDGNFVWAKNMGGPSNNWGRDIAVDSSGNVYTIGAFYNTVDFDPGPGTYNLSSAGITFWDIFVSKLDSSGNFIWAINMGGTAYDHGFGIVLDLSRNVYTTGYFQGTADFDPGPGTYNLVSAGSEDIFVAKFNSDGNLIWAKSMGGGPGTDDGFDIALDSNGNVYTTGAFQGTADFDPGAGTFNLISAGAGDIFVSKLENRVYNVFLPFILR